MPAVTPAPGDYTYQPSVHMVPTYYPPGQTTIQPPPVMYRVPTPPNTPTSNQVAIITYNLKILSVSLRSIYKSYNRLIYRCLECHWCTSTLVAIRHQRWYPMEHLAIKSGTMARHLHLLELIWLLRWFPISFLGKMFLWVFWDSYIERNQKNLMMKIVQLTS